MKIRLRYLSALLPLVLITTQIYATAPSLAGVVDVSECRIPASNKQTISLGFPLRPERISSSKIAQILVVPIAPGDALDYKFPSNYIEKYKTAASEIEKLSFGRAKINFIFAPMYRSKLKEEDFIALKNNATSSFVNADLTKSSWGFVRNTIKDLDLITNFTNIDSVILELGATSNAWEIAEAMQFYPNSRVRPDGFFDPIKTDEGLLGNAILISKHREAAATAHEIMHNYGLTDLYGSGSGPGRLSLMDGGNNKLLNYEKWVLGWIDDSNVTCLNARTLMPFQQPELTSVQQPQWIDPLDGKSCININERIPNQIFELVCLPFNHTHPGSSNTDLFWAQNNRASVATPTPSVSPIQKISPNLILESSIKIKNRENQLIVLNTGSGTALVIEVNVAFNSRRLAFYSLDNEKRPPITLIPPDIRGGTTWTLDLLDSAAIGTLFKSETLSLLVSKITQDEISLALIPESLASTDEVKNLISQSIANRDAQISITRIAAADKAAADKAAADKAAADKAAAVNKPRTISCTKGKIIKKVIGIRPKCPASYKEK